MPGKRTQAGQVNTKQASITDFKIDRAGPTLDIFYKKEDGSAYTPGTWSTQNVVIDIDFFDNGSGEGFPKVEGITADKVTMLDNSMSCTTTADGKYESATVSCSDRLGNTTIVPLGKIWVDTTPPTLTDVILKGTSDVSSATWTTTTSGKFVGTVSDNLSGVKADLEWYRKGSGGDWRTGVTGEHSTYKYTYQVVSVDYAGNRSDIEEFLLWVDIDPPDCSIRIKDDAGASSQTIVVATEDRGSGFEAANWKVDLTFKETETSSKWHFGILSLRSMINGALGGSNPASVPSPTYVRKRLNVNDSVEIVADTVSEYTFKDLVGNSAILRFGGLIARSGSVSWEWLS